MADAVLTAGNRVIYAGLCVAIVAAMTGGCGPLTFTIGDPGDQKMQATVVESDGVFVSDRVAIIDVSGLIANTQKPALLSQGENPVSALYEKLEEARTDRRVKAVVLRLNTPGGTVTASDVMFRQVQRFKERSGKPVIALMMDVTASGGYYLACAADHVVAHPTTITGSIGVIVQTLSVKGALDRWGVHAEAITSGKNKDVGSPLSHLTDEHRAVLRGLVDDMYSRFVDVVKTARSSIPPERFAEVTDGRVFTGEEAQKLGLVDTVGDLYDAFALAKRAAGIGRADLVVYHRKLKYVGSPYATAQAVPAGGTQVNVAQFNFPELPAGSSVGFYYLWQP